jgi:SAM-dependent methyltransferase
MASFFNSAARWIYKLWNPPRFPGLSFLIASRHLLRACCVAAELGIADHVQERPRPAAELAELTQADPRSLYRILRLLTAFGIFREDRQGCFHMTRRARPLLSDGPASMRSWLRCVGRPEISLGFSHAVESVRTGTPLFEIAHDQSFYDYLAANAEFRAMFANAMTSWTDWQRRQLVPAYDFGRFQAILDVGGGTGSLLEHILAKHPRLQGFLVDQPANVAMAKARFDAAGLSDRCRFVGGSFFDELPSGADLCLLKHVLCDWGDAHAVEILRNCHRALAEGGTLLVLEAIVDPRNGADRIVKLFDLEMQAFSGGAARTKAEFESLLTDAGFQFARIHSTAVPDCQIIEARRIAPPKAAGPGPQ